MINTARAIALGTATSGTLDLISAFVFSATKANPVQVMAGVASGPFPAIGPGIGPALVGCLVHYSIMAVMVTVFVLAARRLPVLLDRPVLYGALYGVLLYMVMYRLVLPLRFPATQPRNDWWTITNALFSHCICVGIPMALVERRVLRRDRHPGQAAA